MVNVSVSEDKQLVHAFRVAENVWGVRDLFVNIYIIYKPETSSFVLVDTGLKSGFKKIRAAVAELFPEGTRLERILLTHGHADHAGSVIDIAEAWDVEVFAHELEHPYLNGNASYPPPDPTVGGGLMSLMSPMMPKGPINLGERLRTLPADGSVPFLSGWKYFYTPGHAPGHVSFYREEDKLLIAGDAFVTTIQESMICILAQAEILSGPPKYFTCDWKKAESSVKLLADLLPEVVATGHGKPMRGLEMQRRLQLLARNFRELAVPSEGRYVGNPAITDEHGVQHLPGNERLTKILIGAGLMITAGVLSFLYTKSHYKKSGKVF